MTNLRSCLLVAMVFSGCSGEANQSASAPRDTQATSWRSGTTVDASWSIKWRALEDPIPVGEPFAVEVIVEGDSERLENAEILVDAEMPHHGHGMNFIPVITGTPELWVAQGLLFHMPGRWELSVDVMEGGRMERVQWTVEVE